MRHFTYLIKKKGGVPGRLDSLSTFFAVGAVNQGRDAICSP